MYHYTSSGLQKIYLKNGYEEHDTPYGKGVSIHNVEELHDTIGKHLAMNKQHLTGAEVRFLRIELDMSQKQIAGIIGVSENSWRGWENHRTKITKPAERLLRTIYLEHIGGDGKVRELVERVASMNRAIHKARIELEDLEGSGWHAEAA